MNLWQTSSIRTLLALGLTAMAAVLPQPARAGANLVMNGDFESTTLTASGQITTSDVANWSTTGYNFLFFPGAADTGGAAATGGGVVKLWGPNDGSANGLPATSPTGGNYVAADGAFQVGALTQTVNGLIVGDHYQLTFYWAAGQQKNFSGATTENWNVGFGSSSYTTATVTTPSQGFSPWRIESVVFTATAASQTLSFLAAGTPGGQPPFSLLDGVSLVETPEPASWAALMAGGAAVALLRRRRAGSLTGAPRYG